MTRNTLQREIVFDAVNALTCHPTPDQIFDYINERYPSISRSTVYRNLNILAQNGDVLRVRVPDAADRYDFNTCAHYHVVCENCGRVDDVEMEVNNKVIASITDSFGYDIKDYTVVFSGLCPDCKHKN